MIITFKIDIVGYGPSSIIELPVQRLWLKSTFHLHIRVLYACPECVAEVTFIHWVSICHVTDGRAWLFLYLPQLSRYVQRGLVPPPKV